MYKSKQMRKFIMHSLIEQQIALNIEFTHLNAFQRCKPAPGCIAAQLQVRGGKQGEGRASGAVVGLGRVQRRAWWMSQGCMRVPTHNLCSTCIHNL